MDGRRSYRLLVGAFATALLFGMGGPPLQAASGSLEVLPIMKDVTLPTTITVNVTGFSTDLSSLGAYTLSVTVDGAVPAGLEVEDADTISFQGPNLAAGNGYPVEVAVLDGASQIDSASSSLWYADPSAGIFGVADTAGGTIVTVNGYGFGGYQFNAMPVGTALSVVVNDGEPIAVTGTGISTGTFVAPASSAGAVDVVLRVTEGATVIADAETTMMYATPGDPFNMTQRRWACETVPGTLEGAPTTDCVTAVQFRGPGHPEWTDAVLEKAYGDTSGDDDPPADPSSYLPNTFNPDNLEYWRMPFDHEEGTNFDGSPMDPADLPRANFQFFVTPIPGSEPEAAYLNLSLVAHAGYTVRTPEVRRCNDFNGSVPEGEEPCIRTRELNPDYEYRAVLRLSQDTIRAIQLNSAIKDVVATVEPDGERDYLLTIEGGVRQSQWIFRYDDPESHNWADGKGYGWGAAVFPADYVGWGSCFGRGIMAGSTNGIAAALYWDPGARQVGVMMLGRHLDVPADPVAGPAVGEEEVFSGSADMSISVPLAQCLFPELGIDAEAPLAELDALILNQDGATVTTGYDPATDLIQVSAEGFTYSVQYLALQPKAQIPGTGTTTPGGLSPDSSVPVTTPLVPIMSGPTNAAPTVTPTIAAVPAARPALAVSRGGARVVLRPLRGSTAPAGQSWVASSVRLVPYRAPRTPVTVKVTSAGTWRVKTGTGAITFTPAKGFRGQTSMGYRVRATDGSVFSSFVTVVVRR